MGAKPTYGKRSYRITRQKPERGFAPIIGMKNKQKQLLISAMATKQSSSTEGIKKLEEQITCPVCLEHFTNPKVLPCFHSFCLQCLQGVPIVLVEGNRSLPCPTCRLPCPVPDSGLASLSPSFFTNNLVEVYESMKKAMTEEIHLQPLHEAEFHQLVAAKVTLLERKNDISKNAETIKEEIHQTIAHVKNRLDETEEMLIADVGTAYRHKVSVVDQQIQEIDSVLGQVAECRDHVEQCVNFGSPQQVLPAKPQKMSHAQNIITSVKNKTFHPLEQPDIQLVKSDAIHQIHSSIGNVKSTIFIPAKVHISCSHTLMKQESTIAIAFSVADGSPAPVPPSLVSCHLTPPDNSPPIQCSIKESSQLGHCNVVFTPLTRGLHQLHVTVADRNIPGSPVSVSVSVPPEMRGTPVKTITGLKEPTGVTVTDDGLVIVSESSRHCVTILDREGEKIRSFGSYGNGRGQFEYPQGVAITSKGTVLVSDLNNYRIQEFTMEGVCISCVGGTRGDGPLQFRSPRGIAIKTTGQVLVADKDNHRLHVLNPDLTFSHMFGSRGSEQGQFVYPLDVAIDSQGFMYVTDCLNHRVLKFTHAGKFISSFGTEGSEPGQLHFPSGVTVDDNDLLYINSLNKFVSVYTTSGQYITRFCKGCQGVAGWFQGAAFDHTGGYLYICCPPNVIKY